MTAQESHLVHNLLLFGRLLRLLGLEVNTGRMLDVIHALDFVSIRSKEDFYFAMRSLLVRRREQIAIFDQAFAAFWQAPVQEYSRLEFRSPGEARPRLRAVPPPLAPPTRGDINSRDGSNPPLGEGLPVLQVTFSYSQREALRRKDFSQLSGEEMQAIEWLISQLNWRLGTRRTRRLKAGLGQQLDLRRTFRRNLKYGGEILSWASRQKKEKPRPLVILADISGSMERYTRLLLHFIYSLSEGLEQRVEAFAFSTRLTRITSQLDGSDVETALRQVSHQVLDWSGGTRIGEALHTFNFRWSRRVLGQGAVVLLISDGWDRGDAAILRREIAHLQRSCHRLIWLNPLLGAEGYQPLARGMKTALPYIDDFMPVHNLASLEDLARHLDLLDQSRPVRRQIPGRNL